MAYYEGEVAGLGYGNCNNNDGMFSGGWGGLIGLIAVAALFGWGNGGFGFGGGRGDYAGHGVDAAVQRGFDTQSIISKLDGISNGICDSTFALNNTMTNGFSAVQQSLCQGFNGVNSSISNLGFQLQNCCCDLSRQIDGVNYNMATNTNAIVQAGNANTQRILDFLCTEKISALQAENQTLKFAASQTAQNAFIAANQEAQTAELIRRLGRDCPIPAYVVPNPNCCYGNPVGVNYGGNNCGCGCGCNG